MKALVVALLAVVALPLLLVHVLVWLFRSAALHLAVWLRHRKLVVFVYSDSPKWKQHVEKNILPGLPAGSVVINRSYPWSKGSLAGRMFRYFGGRHEYCPIGIVAERWRTVRVFRFFRSFQEAHHGDLSSLQRVQASFLGAAQDGRQPE